MTSAIDDIYMLTPMQAGLLYHALQDSTGSIYVEQGRCRLIGQLDVERLINAWHRVTERFDVLRISMRWKGLRHPVQVVHRDVELPVIIEDWTQIDPESREQHLAPWLATDLQAGFDFTEPPLFRVALIRFAENEHLLIWTFHHLILDAWAEANVLAEVMQVYETGSPTQSIAPRFRDYVRWVKAIDHTNSLPFWHQYLKDVSPKPVIGGRRQSHRTLLRQIEPEVERDLRKWASNARTTLHSIVLSLWGLFLRAWSKQNDVVFGVTVSGRPPDLPRAFEQAGVLFNTVPFRLQINDKEPISEMVRRVQTNYASLSSHELTPLSAIRSALSSIRETELFDTVAVFLNHGLMIKGQMLGDCEVRDVAYSSRSSYALTFRVMERSPITLELLYDESVLEQPHAISILGALDLALQVMSSGQERSAGEVLNLLTGVIHPHQQRIIESRRKPRLVKAQPQIKKLRGSSLTKHSES
jgi:hypothetical protein